MLSVLDAARISANTSALATVIVGVPDSYFEALDRLQGRCPIGMVRGEHPLLRFDLDAAAESFITRVLAEGGLPAAAWQPLSAPAVAEARAKCASAVDLLATVHPAMPENVRRLIGALLFIDVENCAGGSSNDALGTVWISPRPDWSVARYAECLCHEMTHQALFLEDMLSPLFRIGEDEDEPLIVSSIRRTKRPYESSFHAAVVAGAMIEMYTALGMPIKADEFYTGLAESLAEFRAMPQHLTGRGLELLTELEQIASSARGVREQFHDAAVA